MKTTRHSALWSICFGGALLGASAAFAAPSGRDTAATARSHGAAFGGSGAPEKTVPVKTRCASRGAAFVAGQTYAAAIGGSVIMTSGTPSMEPLIHGKTYAVIQKRPYEAIAKKDLLVYLGRPDASKPNRMTMLHRAVMHDRHGWVMSGDNNRWSESWDRVTAETYVGTVVALFEYPQG